jgi:mannose-6-phosphate isomerase
MGIIFKFEPHYFERVWGGQSLRKILFRKIPSKQKIGEAWDLVDREDCESLISHPQTSSSSIRNLLESIPEKIMGPGWDKQRRFPILVKWLDCTARLSLQVHPPASIASSLAGEPKTENWYIHSTSEEAGLFLGLRNGKTKQDFLKALKNEELELVCHRLNSLAGSSVLVESGRVHAIDAGNLILEIQQNSDTTYRVYDWGRKDQFGQSRDLHIEESLKCINFNDFNAHLIESNQAPVQELASCEHFRIRKFKIKPNCSISLKRENEQCILLNPLGSSIKIGCTNLASGQLGLSPYSEACAISCNEECDVIVTDNFFNATTS